MNSAFVLILLAGGIGTRMGAAAPKQYLPLMGKPIAHYSLKIFIGMPEIEKIVIVCEPRFIPLFTDAFSDPRLAFALPGIRRQDSLYNGICSLEGDPLICVHDAARPVITTSLVRKVVKTAAEIGAAAAAVPVKATIKGCDSDHFVTHTPDRSHLWEMQTPQVVRLSLLKKGFHYAEARALSVTDDISLAELAGIRPQVVLGSYTNIKITTPEDLLIAASFLGSMDTE